jgi:hypothetical protein
MDDKSSDVKSKEISVGELAFQNNKKCDGQNHKSKHVKFYPKYNEIPILKCDIDDQ